MKNQKRVQIKLVSQNHVPLKEDDPESDGIGGPEFKAEIDMANEQNKDYYNKLGIKQMQIDNFGQFRVGLRKYGFNI